MTNEDGFTLVELLVAMTVGSLLLASLGWYTGMLGRAARTGADDPTSQLATSAPLLTRMIMSARPPGTSARFAVDEGHLSLTVPAVEAMATGGLMNVELAVVRDGKGDNLDLVATAGSTRTRPLRLVGAMRRISIETVAGSGPLPRLVSIDFEGKDGAQIRLAAAPRISGSPACIFDPVSLVCR